MEQPESIRATSSSPRHGVTGATTTKKSTHGMTQGYSNRSHNTMYMPPPLPSTGSNMTQRGGPRGPMPVSSNGRTDEHRDTRSHSSSRNYSNGQNERRSSTSRPAFLTTQTQRLQKRQILLGMNGISIPTGDTSSLTYAVEACGLEQRYLKDPTNPSTTSKFGLLGIFPTHPSFPEEQYHYYAKRRLSYATSLPRAFGSAASNWHKQYASFNSQTDLFDKLTSIAELSLVRKSPSGPLQHPNTFGDYILKQVRVFTEPNAHHLWMLDLSRGKFTISELMQTYGGIAREEWKSTPASICPILDTVAKYRCGFMEATWYIQVNVIYDELKENKKSCERRSGDSFYHTKRYQRRAYEWTGQLLQLIASCVRQSYQDPSPATSTIKKPTTPPLPTVKPSKIKKGTSSKPAATASSMLPVPTISTSEKTIYLLKLSQYQLQLHLLDRTRYFQGLLSLYQKALEQRPGSSLPQMPQPVSLIVQLLNTLHALLPDMLENPICIKLLVKIILQHLQSLIPDPNDVDSSIKSIYAESLACSMCSILRDLLLFGTDHVVQLKEEVLNLWPSYILTDRFFDTTIYSKEEISLCLKQCQSKMDEVWARFARLKEYHCLISRKRSRDGTVDKKQRHEVEIYQILDEFHGGKTKLEVDEVYAQIFQDDRWTIDVQAVEAVCEWAVTVYRAQEFKFLSVVNLLEMHNKELCSRNTNLKSRHYVPCLQEPLTDFLKNYAPTNSVELGSLFDLFSLLIRRRLFCTQTFIQDMALVLSDSSRPSHLSPSYHFEYGPNQGGFQAKDVEKLSQTDRLLLYLWQFPRGPSPFGSVNMSLVNEDEATVITWMSLFNVQPEELKRCRTLERVMSLCTTVFSTPSDELDKMCKIVELHSVVKKLSAHDKNRITQWLLDRLYDTSSSFFAGNDNDFTVRLVLLLLELVDVLALLQVLIHFVRHAPVYIVKTVIIPMLDRHQMTFYASQDILALIQAYEFRCSQFRSMGLDPDDRVQTIAMFIARIYQNNSKELDKALKALNLRSPPEVLTKAFFAILKEDKLKNEPAKEKELALEGSNLKFAFPKDKDSMGAELVSVLGQIFLSFSEDIPPSTTHSFPKVMGTADASNEMACRDNTVDNGVKSLLQYNPSTSQQRIFVFRAILTGVMDKWMALSQVILSKKIGIPVNGGMRQVNLLIPQHIHRSVRFLRDFIEAQEEADRKLIRDTLLAWLSKEVIVGFNSTEPKDTKPRSKHPFLTRGEVSGKETFFLNTKGRLDKVQYGLKMFLMSLILHGVVDLSQILRYVLIPGFPKIKSRGKKNQTATKNEPTRSLTNNLLSMTIAYHLIGESPPQYVALDAKTMALVEDPMIKYHWRFVRSMLPLAILFPLLHLLGQISYQLTDDESRIQPREERATLASFILFQCTNDMVVREALFSDKELRERIFKEPENRWLMNIMLKLLSRPLNSLPELHPTRIHLLKAEVIFESMNKWTVHRGGSLYLEVQFGRQVKTLKREKRPLAPIECNSDVPPSSKTFSYEPLVNRPLETMNETLLDTLELSASDKIGMLIVHRLFQRSPRPQFLAPEVLTQPTSAMEMQLAERERIDVDSAHLYASKLLCVPYAHISSPLISAVISQILQNLEVDAKDTVPAEFVNTFNGSMVATFLRRILTWHLTPSNIYARYMRSMLTQFEYLFDAAKESKGTLLDATIRRKLALRLQLVSIAASITNYTQNYRNGIVKLLISFLETPLVSQGAGLTLFSWILDLLPLIPSSVFSENDPSELVTNMKLPAELKHRLFAVLPQNSIGRPRSIKRKTFDPWALLEGFADLPSDALVPSVPSTHSKAKRRRIWRAI